MASKLGLTSFGDSYMCPMYRFFEAKMHGRYTSDTKRGGGKGTRERTLNGGEGGQDGR